MHTPTTYYAIQQISTGYYMPIVASNHRGGGSYVEPIEGCVPRLWKRETDAAQTLSRWLKGYVIRKVENTEYGTEYVGTEYIPTKGRNPKDMKVVPLILTTPNVQILDTPATDTKGLQNAT